MNTNTFQTGFRCALGLGAMHTHERTGKKKIGGKGDKLKYLGFSYRQGTK